MITVCAGAKLYRLQHLKQAEAAQILGMTRPRVSDVINRQPPRFTIDAPGDMLAGTGKRVEFSIA